MLISGLSSFYLSKVITKSYINIYGVFIFFHLMYSVSPILTAIYDENFSSFYPLEWDIEHYLILSLLALHSCFLGFLLITKPNQTKITIAHQKSRASTVPFYYASLILSFLALAMEVINVIRVGGVSSIFLGKGDYQTLVGGLTLSLPSKLVFLFATIFYGFFIANKKKKVHWPFLIVSTPLIALYIILGFRSSLMLIVIALLVTNFYHKGARRISLRLMISGIVIYLIMTTLVLFRPYMKVITGPDRIAITEIIKEDFFRDRILESFNPANVEFGSSFFNFSVHKHLEEINKANYYKGYGMTYINGLHTAIPSFFYLGGKKPNLVTYSFRDTAFPSLYGNKSTGFSSILEAYINFGNFGVVLVYTILGLCFGFLEYLRQFKKSTIAFVVFYISCLNYTVFIHRSALGSVIAGLMNLQILFAVTVFVLLIVIKKMPKYF